MYWNQKNFFTLLAEQKPGAVEGERLAAVASLPISSLEPRSIVLTPDGADLIGLFAVTAPTWEGRLIYAEKVRVVERWNLATRTRRWSRTLPPMPAVQNPTYPDNDDLLTLSPRGLFATRCTKVSGRGLSASCDVIALDEHTGALGPAEAWTSPDLDFSWRDAASQQVSPGRRYTLVNGRLYREPHFLMFDDRGRIVGVVMATCARFAEGGSEEAPSILIDEKSDLRQNVAISRRFRLVKDASACKLQHSPTASVNLHWDEARAMSSYHYIGGGRRIVWSSTPYAAGPDEPISTHFIDIERVGLPAPLLTPPPGAEGWLSLTGSGSDLYVFTKDTIFHLEDSGFVFDSANPRCGGLRIRGNDALMQSYAGLDASKYVLAVGERRPDKQGFTCKKTSAVSQFKPDFVTFENAGRRQMLIAGGREGLQWVDLRTGQVFRRGCLSGAGTPGPCRDRVTYHDHRGLVMSSARQTAFTTHHRLHVERGRRENSIDEIELSTGKLLRSFPAPFWDTTLPLDLPMGWLEKERRFWIEGREDPPTTSASITIVTLPDADGAPPKYESFGTISHYPDFGADPEGRYFVFGRDFETLDVFSPDGTLVLTMGVRPEGGAFAQTGDGRFACTGSACGEFRCVVGDEVRPVGDPACAALRAEGFSILDELSRIQKAREAGKTSER
ncbi:hypothetical protein [Polyangium aurulentum]|uniref:hypothetical protein n=1 Tax=Polyangium aurulentum TaxID=2567896 RepID=UPI00113E492C|nr:hypothetical protein [Polyangium aurulentum]UQA59926.1 hypothetical protein E8A73_005385 [Polyangium aurulentum]